MVKLLGAATKYADFFLLSISIKYLSISEEAEVNLLSRVTHTVNISQLLSLATQVLAQWVHKQSWWWGWGEWVTIYRSTHTHFLSSNLM